MPDLKAHMFICTSCTYKKPNGEMSSEDEAFNLRKCVKNKIVDRFGKDKVRVSAVNCLGECDDGIASVTYPNGEWKMNLRPENADELIEFLQNKAQA